MSFSTSVFVCLCGGREGDLLERDLIMVCAHAHSVCSVLTYKV